MNPETKNAYRWEEDWPKVGWERIRLGSIPDGYVARPVYAEQPLFFRQEYPDAPQVEITREEYERTIAEWEAVRAVSSDSEAPKPHINKS